MNGQIARFKIRDARGELVAIHVRRDGGDGGKTFWWEGPSGSTGLAGIATPDLPLYGSEDVAGWAKDEPIIVVEGEKARDALKRVGLRALGSVTGAGSCPELEPLEVLRGRNVTLWPDADDVGRGHIRKLAERLVGIAASIRVFEWTGAPDHGDAADYLAYGLDAAERLHVELASAGPLANWLGPVEPATSVVKLVAAAFGEIGKKSQRDDLVAALRTLADKRRSLDQLSQVALTQEAIECLKANGLAAPEARELVRAAFMADADASPSRRDQGTALDLGEPSPWPDAVDGAALADEMTDLLLRYVVLPLPEARTVVLWIIFTYLLEHCPVAPRLLIASPTKACGKTRLLSLLWAMVRRALPASSITAAAVYRVIEAYAPTLLVDEVDNLGLTEKRELLAVLNSGHSRGAALVLRIVGEDHEVRRFSTWCALAMAAIRPGSLPDTLVSRAIKIQLTRKRKNDAVARLREGQVYAELEPLRRKLMRWSVDHASTVEAANPVLPDQLDGRAADNWSVLISIADALGDEWPTRVRHAAVCIEAAGANPISTGEILLADLHELFRERGDDRISSEEIVSALTKLEGRPWAEWGTQRKPLSKNQLARLLKEFGISPGSIRLADQTTAKGYLRESFEDAWERYASAGSPTDPSRRHNPELTWSNHDSSLDTREAPVTDQNSTEAAPITPCDGVTLVEASSEEAQAQQGGSLGVETRRAKRSEGHEDVA